MEILDGLVIPVIGSLIGRELVEVEKAPYVLACTSVKTGDGRAAVRTVVTGGSISCINACEDVQVVSFGVELLVGGIEVRIDRGHVKILHA